ncbi:MAG: AAA family ATPase [Verrucomicrobiaceae bacterium]|nr:AAA family ATPase [Verrucomicrobiaceae bacterium]
MPAFSLDAESVLQDLRAFVAAEFAAQRLKFAEQRAKPRIERVEDGTCIESLRFQRLDEAGRAVFNHAGNDSRLREGDLVTLRQAEDGDEILANLFREEAGEMWLVTEKGFKAAMFSEPSGWFMDEAFLDLESHYLAAFDRLPMSAIGQECILPLLMGSEAPEFDEEEFNGAMEDLQKQPQAWEDAQRDAIASCLAVERCCLVQGPPGTGKTRVLAQVVRRLVERGERVLITAFTHRAIDNALSATAREMNDRDRVARICAPMHRRDENFDRYEFFATSPLASQSGGWVAATTPFALRKRLPGVEFDTIVIDEAGQMTTALAIMAMLSGRKYLLFGDQEQLGPVVMSRSRREVDSIGIFHALRSQAKHGTCLDVTYRLNDKLAAWPSENFYQGELVPAPVAASRRLACKVPPQGPEWLNQVITPETPLVWLGHLDEASRTLNAAEVSAAAEILRALHLGGVKPEDIAVVTPYRKQARAMRRRLETLMPDTSWRGCVIDTVERMQGQEREVIVFSMCASDPGFIQRQAEFLFDPRRLNVAATRASSKMIILASDSLLHTDLHDTDLAEDQALLRSLARFAHSIRLPA